MNTNKILNWNCNGLYAHDFQLLLKTYNPIIITLQETNLRNTSLLNLKSYNILRKEIDNAERAHGSVILAVENTIYHTQIILNTNL